MFGASFALDNARAAQQAAEEAGAAAGGAQVVVLEVLGGR